MIVVSNRPVKTVPRNTTKKETQNMSTNTENDELFDLLVDAYAGNHLYQDGDTARAVQAAFDLSDANKFAEAIAKASAKKKSEFADALESRGYLDAAAKFRADRDVLIEEINDEFGPTN